MNPQQIDLSSVPLEEVEELLELLRRNRPFHPLPGPQEQACVSPATIVGYGGAAGGGKSYLGCGLSVTEHRKVAIFRQNGTELTAIVDELAGIFGSRDDYSESKAIWRTRRYDGQRLQIELGSFPNRGDEKKYQGRPHDLLVFDEAANMREEAVRFLMGWLRTTTPGQRCRVLMCFNPPTTVEGRWIMNFFGPWLDRKHPNPAKPGELRWFTTIAGKDTECEGPDPITLEDGKVVKPLSRTFIPSRVQDNPFLMGTHYYHQLEALPEPLRSQMLYGDFLAGVEDDPWQVIPTTWVEQAMERWTKPTKLDPMDSMGVDVAMRGDDNTVIARRHGMWFDEPIVYKGRDCTSGSVIGGFCLAAVRDRAPIHLDLFGVGAQPYGHLMAVGVQVLGVNVGDPAGGVAKDGRVRFKNLRTELWWRMREALDPDANTGICLPPSQALLADLCTPKWELVGNAIQVESRDNILKKLGKSPDYASAYVLGLMDTPKLHVSRELLGRQSKQQEYNPYEGI